MTTTIDKAFQSCRSDKRLAFMPFITAGDPDLAATQALVRELSGRGVDLIEVGFPYSDPIADGPVIQSSYTRALAKKLTVPQIFEAIRNVAYASSVREPYASSVRTGKAESLNPQERHAGSVPHGPPLVAMVSFALMFRRGAEWFVDEAKQAGFSGFIVPDLPGDEAADLFALVRSRGLDLVQLVAPTTPRERVKNILRHCSGFVYCIAVAGTTGERDRVADTLLAQLKWLRQETDLPLAVGFGISRPEHVEPLKGLADGVIVGSAIVKQLDGVAAGSTSIDKAVSGVGAFAEGMVRKCHAGSPAG